MKYLIAILITIIMSGCAASTYNGMVTKPNITKKEFIVNKNYKKLYKDASIVVGNCLERGMITAAIVSDKELDTESKTANISVYMIGGFGKQYYHILEFKQIDVNKTNLLIYTEYGEDTIEKLRAEVTRDCIDCECY